MICAGGRKETAANKQPLGAYDRASGQEFESNGWQVLRRICLFFGYPAWMAGTLSVSKVAFEVIGVKYELEQKSGRWSKVI